MKAFQKSLLVLCLLPSLAVAQKKVPTQFDVIAVKPHKAGDRGGMGRWNSTGYEETNVTLRMMISKAYNVQAWLVLGLPPWADTMRWDIQAKVTDPEAETIDQLTMKQRDALTASLLRERFGLVAHTETKVQPVFRMTVMPDGLKFKPSPPPPPGQSESYLNRSSFLMHDGVATARNLHLSDLADTLSRQVERTVLDKTGLTGEYDFQLRWQREDKPGDVDNGANGDAPPTILEAVKEQLGLKMTADKAPVPTVVVDKLVQPEAN